MLDIIRHSSSLYNIKAAMFAYSLLGFRVFCTVKPASCYEYKFVMLLFAIPTTLRSLSARYEVVYLQPSSLNRLFTRIEEY